MRYRLRKSSPRFISTKEIAETRDRDVARMVAINDQPLSPDAEQREQARLDALLSDPARQRAQAERGIRYRNRPQAAAHVASGVFLRIRGVGQGSSGTVEKFHFHPNPAFSPPDMETQALTAMSGELWIDAAQERVTRLEGHLQQDTNYGFGILGKLDKGGWIVLSRPR